MDEQERSDHWDDRFGSRAEADLSWFEADPALSFRLVTAHARPDEPVLDVGAGLSRLADRLIAAGYGQVTILDVSAVALEKVRARIGPTPALRTIRADVTRWVPDARWALWHDRAVFHFLTSPDDRAAYVAAMDRALAPGGTAILMTFAEDGPGTCSGLPVRRWSPEALAAEIARLAPGRFSIAGSARHLHRTPGGLTQPFGVTVLRKAAA
ncbi:MAG: class I SAM-dependent methyltransferase [Rhodobacteraceae bacterium]|nr:class I SAM-dependent methyltransferase [Paracoccaceae bacterium]